MKTPYDAIAISVEKEKLEDDKWVIDFYFTPFRENRKKYNWQKLAANTLHIRRNISEKDMLVAFHSLSPKPRLHSIDINTQQPDKQFAIDLNIFLERNFLYDGTGQAQHPTIYLDAFEMPTWQLLCIVCGGIFNVPILLQKRLIDTGSFYQAFGDRSGFMEDYYAPNGAASILQYGAFRCIDIIMRIAELKKQVSWEG